MLYHIHIYTHTLTLTLTLTQTLTTYTQNRAFSPQAKSIKLIESDIWG